VHNDEIRIDERYVSFENIDCFENACVVVDNMLRVLENPEHMNLYWKKILPMIPEQAYKARNAKLDESEVLLYLICSNVFYIEELFENADDAQGLAALKRCELECC
jgi:N(2)-fixation sustaining protein CowN